MEQKRRIAVLGSTGSIGTQALDVVRQHPDMFQVELLTANNNSGLLIRQAIEYDANAVVICNESKYDEVARELQPRGIKVFAGMESVCDLVTGDNIDIVLASMVGFSGLRPTMAAINAGKAIALANKETLVAAGSVVMEAARKNNVPILPVDSEHSAIFQCLQGALYAGIEKIHLTASGGPFRTWSVEDVAKATKKEALNHPKWNMGNKITIDSATMMNKGLEIIEAKWLFNVDAARINVVVHPQSIIHSMVEFEDGAVIAQLGHPDMREPIQYALAYPQRLCLDNRKLDFAQIGKLEFFAPDPDKFPALRLSYDAIARGGNMPCIMNAANEVAVDAFLKDRIGFYDITDIIAECMSLVPFVQNPCLDDIFATDEDAKSKAKTLVSKYL